MRADIQGNLDLGVPQIGDELELNLRVRVVGIEEDLIDVTQIGDRQPRTVVGEVTTKFLILESRTS